MHKRLILGQSLFEIMVAVGVMAIITGGIVALATSSIRNTTFTKNNALATRYNQQANEWIRGERDTDWTIFIGYVNSSSPGYTYCLDSLSWAKGAPCNSNEYIGTTQFNRQVVFSGVSATAVNTAVMVSWTDAQGVHQVRTDTVLTDWKSH